MSTVDFVEATCHYPGNSAPSVDSLSLHLDDGEFLVLVGPSGSGKSTALRMLAGLEQVTSGEVRIDDVDVSDTSPKDRDIAMVFQNYALYPHMTVAQNMGFALRLAGVERSVIADRVREAAVMLDLTAYLDRKPRALSGGQRQRVAMGRAIVRSPRVFLMDEPLSNLDAKLRVQTRAEIAALQHRLGTSTVYVTHDQTEAMTLGHRVAVLRDGLLEQVDVPRALYDRPATVFVAGFIGSPAMNILRTTVTADGAVIGGRTVPVPRTVLTALDGADRVDLGIRPECLGPGDGLAVDVTLVEDLGADVYVHGTVTHDGEPRTIVVRIDGRSRPTVGERLHVGVDPTDLHFFDVENGTRID